MNALLDFFSHEAGPYAPNLLPVAEMNPINDVQEAMAAGRDGDYGRMAMHTAIAAAPVVAGKIAKGINPGMVDDAAQWLEDALMGFSVNPTRAALTDIAKEFKADDVGALKFGSDAPMSEGAGSAAEGGLRTDSSDIWADPLSIYAAPAGSRNSYLGAAPDRSDVSFVRYRPKKPSPRVAASVEALSDPSNPVRHMMDEDVARGAELGGMDWYNTEELRDWFVNAHGEIEGDRQWREFMYLNGTTSPGSRVEPNIANASAVRRRMYTDPDYIPALEEVEKLADAGPLAKSREKGYGHKTQGLQELVTARYQQGGFSGAPEPDVSPAKGSWVQNPKPKGFSNSLLGNERNIAADLHFTRYMGMASEHPDWLENVNDVSNEFAERIMSEYPGSEKYFKTRDVNGKTVWNFSPKRAVKDGVVPMDSIKDYPSVWSSKPNDNEYAAFEDFMGEYSRAEGQTAGQGQANLWMGAADRTGVDPDSQGTFMEILRNRADKTAAKTGKTRAEVIDNFIRNYGLLSAAGGAFTLNQMSADQGEVEAYLNEITGGL